MKPLSLFTVFMPSEDTVSYCGKFMRRANRRLGEDAFNHVIGWGPDPCALYPLMSPLFAHQGYSEFALRIQGLRYASRVCAPIPWASLATRYGSASSSTARRYMS